MQSCGSAPVQSCVRRHRGRARRCHRACRAHERHVPQLPNTDRVVEVRQQSELLGALGVAKRGHEALTPIEEKLLADLGHQAGLCSETFDLPPTAGATRGPARIAAAAGRCTGPRRRRLERNLHDGAQQHLVAIKVKLGMVEMLLTRDPARAGATIVELNRRR